MCSLYRRRFLPSGLAGLALLTFLFCCLLAYACGEDQSIPELTDSGLEPTCVESGYRIIDEEGVIRLEEIPPKGHQYTDWVTDSEGKTKTRKCEICGYEQTFHISTIPEDSIPRLDLRGSMEGIGKKARVTVEAEYQSKEQNFTCYGILTLQGHSTFGLPKKNYTIRFCDDPKGNEKHQLQFKNWKKEHKFILKANYADLSQCRNLAGGRIWADMIQTRENVPSRILQSKTYGTVDGFPIIVYLNDSFLGLYTLNLHKDDDLYRLRKEKQEALLICNAQTTEESLFRAEAVFDDDYSSDWEIEFCGTEDASWARESFNTLISFVMNSNDQEFRDHLGDYLDTDAAVDYLLLLYALGLQNSGAKDLVMVNYGDKWIPSAFDMEEAFGLDINHAGYLKADDFLPELSEGKWSSGTGSLLWDRLLNTFTDRIIARYHFLRGNSLSSDFMKSCVYEFLGNIPEVWYDEDFYMYPDRPIPDTDMNSQIERYIEERMPILDRVFEGEME